MDAYVRVSTARARNFITLEGRLMGDLLEISILILLIGVDRLRNLARLRYSTVDLLRTRGRTRRNDLTNSIEAGRACSTIEEGRRIRIIRRGLLTGYLLRVLDLSGLITRAEAIESRSFRLLLTLLLLLIRRLLMEIRADLALDLANLEHRTGPFRLTLRYLTTLENYLLLLGRSLNLLIRP